MSGEQSMNRAALRSEAAHWYNLRLAGDVTLEDEYRFREWLDRSDANRDAYRAIDKAWTIAGTAKNDPALSNNPAQERLAGYRAARRWPGFAIAAAILLMIGFGWATLPGLWSGAGERSAQAFHTETGQRTTVTLPDGSVVTLDSETEMRFAETSKLREVDLLRGRAFFRVASNHARPFIVNAGGKRVRAVGTAFEVSLDRGEMAVVLAEGKVQVDETGGGNSTVMVPGRQLVIGTDRNWTLSSVDVNKETSWTEGRLIFMHDPLSKAVAEVNRYSTRKLRFQNGAIPDKQIVGVFSAGDIDGFVKALELNDIARRVSTTGDEIILAGN